MPFDIPALRKLITDGEKDIAIELGLQTLPPVGVEKALNVTFSSQVRDLYDHQSWIKDQIIPSVKADDDTIIETAASEGVIRKQATFSVGPVIFPGLASIPEDTEMQTSSGALYLVVESGMPQNGQVVVKVQASDAGVAGNLPEGETMTLLSPVPGVESDGAVGTGGLTGGADIEPVAEVLDRLLYRKRNPPVGGALHDYVIWAREMPGVSRAWSWDAWHGPGTVGLAWVYDGRDDITPTFQDRANMEAYQFRHADPATGNYVGKPGGIEVWPVEIHLKPVPLTIRLTPDTQATRQSVEARLLILQQTMAPGQTMGVSALRTAIGTATGVTDYTLDVNGDIPCDQNELITVGVITWLTA
jgi:uncharacterized phage protein gp47/JayE